MAHEKSLKPRLLKVARITILALLILFILVGSFRIAMIIQTRSYVTIAKEAPQAQAALVLGAGLLADGSPSDPLRDRVDMAISLYQAGKVQKLLLSGDNRFVYYNEPAAMKAYALSKGIPETDIVLDFAGRRTYDSCFRAQAIFGLDEIVIVTQNYHLPRALFLCNRLNVKAIGIPADQTRYLRSRYIFWRFREVVATLAAYYDIYIHKPLPVLGDYEPIFPGSP